MDQLDFPHGSDMRQSVWYIESPRRQKRTFKKVHFTTKILQRWNFYTRAPGGIPRRDPAAAAAAAEQSDYVNQVKKSCFCK